MSKRDRLVIAGIAAVVVLAFGWMEFVSPEKKKVTALDSKVETAHQQLQSAQNELSTARSAQARYSEAYAAMVKLGKAVPAQQEIPGLVYELDQASNHHHVEFTAITSGTTGSGGGSSSASASSSSTANAGAPASFTAMPFTFTFNGSFAQLYHLVNTVQGFDIYSPTDGVTVNGRLLSIQSINLVPAVEEGAGATGAPSGGKGKGKVPGEHLVGTITATAYVLPPSQSLPSATPPAGGATSGTPSSGSGSSATSSATIKALP